ncbi:MAG TPA: hypothetical protein VIL92_10420 [Gaiellaceae bacterium]
MRWPARTVSCAGPAGTNSASSPTSSWTTPKRPRRGLRDAYRRLLDLDFDLLLLAHGDPVVTSGKEALGAFAH